MNSWVPESIHEKISLTGETKRRIRRTALPWLLLTPLIIWLVLFKYIAVVYNIVLSFSEMTFTGEMTLIGLDNYETMINDPIFWESLFNTFILFLNIPVAIAIAIGIAILLDKKFPAHTMFRSIFFLPYITMMVAVAVIWRYMFTKENGVVNYLLSQSGLITENISWLGDPTYGLIAIFITQIWKSTGFYVVIILAGLQTIPDQVYEVARIDGASKLQQFLYITLPLLKSTIGVCILVGMVISFRLFDLILVLTNGGPDHGTEIVLTWIYKQAFTYSNFGYAAALSVVMVLFGLGIAVIGQRFQAADYQ